MQDSATALPTDITSAFETRYVDCMSNQIFDPASLEQMCRHDLPGALRLLADHLEQKEISATLWSFQGNGMIQDWRRTHFLMTLDLAVAPLPPTKSEFES